jgi:zinc transport system substrate-binding protein
MNQKLLKYTMIVFSLMLFLTLTSCANIENKDDGLTKLQVAVSIVPEQAFVEAVAGDLIDVVVMIPPGGSHTNYQPTPKQMTALGDASVYFAIGVETEIANILPNMNGVNRDIKVVHLEDMVDNIYPARYFGEDEVTLSDTLDANAAADESDHDHTGRDPHIWMSPKRVIIMIEGIRDTLIELDPVNKLTYTDNAAVYIKELEAKDAAIKIAIESLPSKSFVIMHPSLGYFADEYGLQMLAIEEDGKETTAKRLESIIDFVKANDIKVIFYQAEFDSQQAKTIAEEIGGETIELDILSLDYLGNLDVIYTTFTKVLE